MTPNPIDLNEILDECLLAVVSGQASVEDCLTRYPQVADQLKPLLKTAAHIHTIPKPPKLAIEKRRAIEQQLLSRAVPSRAVVAPRQAAAPGRRAFRLRWGLIAIIFSILLVGGTGVITASATSLPSDVLYPVKRLTEQVSLATASSSAQANLHVDLARRRLDEFEALAKRADVRPELMTEALIEMSAALQAAAALPESQQRQVADAVVRLADVQVALAASLSTTASLATRASLEASAAAAVVARDQAFQLAGVQPPPDIETLVTSTPTDQPTLAAVSTPTEAASVVPTLIEQTASPTGTVKPKPTLPVVKPTDKATKTPKPPNTPPGQVKTPNTPPGQVKTPKPDTAPPGQDKPPKPKK